MDRRSFFKWGMDKSKSEIKDIVKEKIKEKVKRKFLRPPGAIVEDQFLLTCTRCGDCAPACPYDSVHLIGVQGGIIAQTPFIDPYHSACRFCKDMPCINSCKAKALSHENLKMGTAKINEDHCLVKQGQRCDYCFKSCPEGIKAIIKTDTGVPTIDKDSCVGCGQCAYICVSQTGKAIEILSDY